MNWNQEAIRQLLDAMAEDCRRHMQRRGLEALEIVGIHSGGAWVARALHQRLAPAAPLGTLDISFYRDDFTRRGLNPRVKPTKLPFEVEGRNLLLVDDVLMTGRTIRAAMNELFDFGRPASISLAVLFDIGRRELPIAADICGEGLALAVDNRVELHGPSPLVAEIVEKQ